MEALRGAGLSPDDVLASSTIVAARAMGFADETGSIETGEAGGSVVLDADPLSDVANYRHVRLVMRNGALHRHAELVPSP